MPPIGLRSPTQTVGQAAHHPRRRHPQPRGNSRRTVWHGVCSKAGCLEPGCRTFAPCGPNHPHPCRNTGCTERRGVTEAIGESEGGIPRGYREVLNGSEFSGPFLFNVGALVRAGGRLCRRVSERAADPAHARGRPAAPARAPRTDELSPAARQPEKLEKTSRPPATACRAAPLDRAKWD